MIKFIVWPALTLSILLVGEASLANTSIGASLGGSNLVVNGSGYEADSEFSATVAGEYSIDLNKDWRAVARAASSFTGTALSLGVGGAYHFWPYRTIHENVGDNIQVTQSYKWSPFVAFEMSMTRVQISLSSSENSANTDVVLASLIGATIRGGAYYSLRPNLSLSMDLSTTFGVSSKVSSSNIGASIGLVLFP